MIYGCAHINSMDKNIYTGVSNKSCDCKQFFAAALSHFIHAFFAFFIFLSIFLCILWQFGEEQPMYVHVMIRAYMCVHQLEQLQCALARVLKMNNKCKEEAKTDSRYEQNRFARNGITTYKQKIIILANYLCSCVSRLRFILLICLLRPKQNEERVGKKGTRARVSEQQKKEEIGQNMQLKQQNKAA